MNGILYDEKKILTILYFSLQNEREREREFNIETKEFFLEISRNYFSGMGIFFSVRIKHSFYS